LSAQGKGTSLAAVLNRPFWGLVVASIAGAVVGHLLDTEVTDCTFPSKSELAGRLCLSEFVVFLTQTVVVCLFLLLGFTIIVEISDRLSKKPS